MGDGTVASGENSIAMGKYNNPADADGNPHILSVGDGSSDSPSNSLAINYDNKIFIGEAKMPLGSEVEGDMSNLLETLASMGIITIK